VTVAAKEPAAPGASKPNAASPPPKRAAAARAAAKQAPDPPPTPAPPAPPQQAAKEQAAKEQAAKEQAAKEQAAKEQAAKEQAAKEQAAKEQAAAVVSGQEVLQDRILSTVKTGQEATLHLAEAWLQTFASLTPKLFDSLTMPNLDNYYGFAERLWSTNRNFVVSMLEIASDVGKRVPQAAKSAAVAARAN